MSNENMEKLLGIMAKLRDPNGGCPWDLEQDFDTIAPCTLEEAYEVVDAIERKDMQGLQEELGDLLLQVVFHSQMAKEKNIFEFDDVVKGLADKLVFRHPHVFGDGAASSAGDVMKIWETRKAEEKQRKAVGGAQSVLDDIPLALPALARAQKISKRAAKVGFEWDKTEDVLDKVIEEVEEMRQAIRNKDTANMEEELGDIFFVLVNLGRHLGIDCEESARKSNIKFERRFKGMEENIKLKNEDMKSLTLEEWTTYWDHQKTLEKKSA
jgi:ATP diphosphatase